VSKPEEESSIQRAGKRVIAGLLFVMTSFGLASACRDIYDFFEVYQWPRVSARVRSAEVMSYKYGGRGGVYHGARIVVAYEWQGRGYVSDGGYRHVEGGSTIAQTLLDRALRAKSSGLPLLVSVNPNDPRDVALFREVGMPNVLVGVFLILVLHLAMGIYLWRSMGLNERMEGPVLRSYVLSLMSIPILWKAPAEIALGRGPAIYIALLLPLGAVLSIVALTRK
jgi:hypothetical protein